MPVSIIGLIVDLQGKFAAGLVLALIVLGLKKTPRLGEALLGSVWQKRFATFIIATGPGLAAMAFTDQSWIAIGDSALVSFFSAAGIHHLLFDKPKPAQEPGETVPDPDPSEPLDEDALDEAADDGPPSEG